MQIWQSLKWHFYFHHAKKKKKNRTDSFRPFTMHYGENLPTYSSEMNTQLDPVPLQFCFVLFFFYEEELMRTLWIVAEVAPPVSFRLALSVLNNCLSIYAAAANSKSWSVIGPCNIISWPRSATAYNISRLCVLTVDGKKVTKSNETEIILTDRIST